MAGIIDSAALAINVITYAKQIEGYFANGENFDKAKTHEKGSIVADDVTAAEIADAAFFYDPAATGTSANSPAMAFLNANASLSEGIPEIGAMYVPADARQGFVTTKFNVLLRSLVAAHADEHEDALFGLVAEDAPLAIRDLLPLGGVLYLLLMVYH